MPREIYRWDREKRELVKIEEFRRVSSGPVVVSDIAPYKNIIDGKEIGGRRQHRDFLRAHDVVEIGNEMPKRSTPELDSPRDALKQAWDRATNR